jgi:hypothetical protein
MMSFIDGDEYDARTRAASARITGSDQASAAQGEDRRNERRWLATASWLDGRRSTRSRQAQGGSEINGRAARESGLGRARRQARCPACPRMRRRCAGQRAFRRQQMTPIRNADAPTHAMGTHQQRHAVDTPARLGYATSAAPMPTGSQGSRPRLHASATGPSQPIRCVQFLPAPPALFPAMRPNTEPAIRPVPPG